MSDAGDELPDRCHFFGVNEFAAQFGGVSDVGHDHHDAVDVALLVAHGAEVDGELADIAIPARDVEFQVIDLHAAQSGLERIRQRTDVTGSGKLQQGTPEKFFLLEAGLYQRRLA